jgi:exopolysaccharide biosynthesis protein
MNDGEKHPRTFIAQTYNGEYIVGVVSGQRGSEAIANGEPGMNLHELSDFVTSQYSDVKMIYNLDGGGSSFLYYNGQERDNISDEESSWASSAGHRYLPELICFD